MSAGEATRPAALRALASLHLDDARAAAVTHLARSSLVLEPRPDEHAPFTGLRFGGAPALSRDTKWPSNLGHQLTFLLQVPVSMAAISIRALLPRAVEADDALFFFADVSLTTAASSVHVTVMCGPLRSAGAAAARSLTTAMLPPTAARVREALSIPALEAPEIRRLALSRTERGAYARLRTEWSLASGGPRDALTSGVHRLGGHPDLLDDMGQPMQPAEEFILQVSSDAVLDLEFGDAGKFFVFTKPLATRESPAPATGVVQSF